MMLAGQAGLGFGRTGMLVVVQVAGVVQVADSMDHGWVGWPVIGLVAAAVLGD